MNFNKLQYKCDIFYKAAKKQMIIMEHNDPVLSKLSEIEDHEERVEFATENFEKLGEGSSRAAFKLPNNTVLKVAINDRGVAQNINEASPKMQRPCTIKILIADPNGKWLIMEWSDKISAERFKELTGMSFNDFGKALFYKFNASSDKYKKPRAYDEIIENKLFNCIVDLISGSDLLVGDVAKLSSWGEVDGRAVIRDTGLTRQIYDELYS